MNDEQIGKGKKNKITTQIPTNIIHISNVHTLRGNMNKMVFAFKENISNLGPDSTRQESEMDGLYISVSQKTKGVGKEKKMREILIYK